MASEKESGSVIESENVEPTNELLEDDEDDLFDDEEDEEDEDEEDD